MTWSGTLRRKIVLVLAGVVAAVTLLLLLAGRAVVTRGFGALEEQQAHHRAWLSARQLEAEQVRISELALDYAAWDDMLAYVNRQSESFIESAIPPEWLSRVRLELVAVLDRDARVLFAKSINGGASTRALPEGLDGHLQPGRPLTLHASAAAERTGLIRLPSGIWVVSSRPIVTSAATGPVSGTFLLGRRIDADLLERFSTGLALPVSLRTTPLHGTPVADGYEMVLNSRSAMTAVVPLTDIYGSPISWLTVSVPREVEAQRSITLYYLLGSLIAGAVVFVGAVVALLNGFIVKRMASLVSFLRDVDATGNLRARVADTGEDEIGHVAQAVNDLLQTIEHRNQTIERLARTDALTGLPNRRTFDEQLEQQISRARRKREPLSVIVADIDHFKAINDRFGHATGDHALVHTASVLASRTRSYDTAARYGGEEFAILLQGTGLADAVVIAERVRLDLEESRAPGYPGRITISLGVAEWQPGESPDSLISRADTAMYVAKRNGRNRVEMAGPVGVAA